MSIMCYKLIVDISFIESVIIIITGYVSKYQLSFSLTPNNQYLLYISH